MQFFLDKKNKKEIEKTILNDILNNSSKKFQYIYKIKQYSSSEVICYQVLKSVSFFLKKKKKLFYGN